MQHIIRSHHRRAHTHSLRRAEWWRDNGALHAQHMELARRARLALQATKIEPPKVANERRA